MNPRRLLPLLIISTSFAHEKDGEQVFNRYLNGESDWGLHLHSDFESRYSSEGRDALDGDGLVSATFEAAWKAVSVGIWYGRSPDQAYDELQLSSALSWAWKELEWYVAYTHLRFPEDGGHDHEIGIGTAWSGLPWQLSLALDAYHSLDAEGTFIEASLHREFGLAENLRLVPAIVFGVNQGYVADGHDGANHLALRLGAEYSLNDSVTLTAHLSQSFAIRRDADRYPGDGQLRDFFHLGIGLGYEF
jgi:hypothetical protein